jgi:hypothetical protein
VLRLPGVWVRGFGRAEAAHHEGLGAGEGDIAPEAGRDDGDVPRQGLEGLAANGVANKVEEPIALGLGDRAPDHDPVRVERVHVADARNRDRAPSAGHQVRAGTIAGALARRHVDRRQLAVGVVPRSLGEERRLAAVDHRVRQLREARAACVCLDVADAAAAALGAVEGNRDVAQLAREAVRPVQQLAAQDDRATDSGRDGQVDEVVAVPGGAKRALAERCDVGVPIKERRQAEALAEGAGKLDVPELRAKVRGVKDDAADRVERPGGGDADSRDVASASRAASMQSASTAAGPSSFGVGRSKRACRVPSGSTIAARIRVPPRSTAMTGREDRAKPLVSFVRDGFGF